MSGNNLPQVGNDFVVARPQPSPVRISYKPAPAVRLATPALSLELTAPLPSYGRRREFKLLSVLEEVFESHTVLIFILLSALIIGLASQVGMSYWNSRVLVGVGSETAYLTQQAAHMSADKLMLTLPAGSLNERMRTVANRAVTIAANDDTITVDQATVRSWLTSASDGNRATITVNPTAIKSSIQTLTSSLITPVINQVTTDHGGTTTPQQIIAGKDGTEITNLQALTMALATNLLKGNTAINLSADIRPVAFRSVTPAAFDKLLEADVTTKTLYAYEKGQLVQTFPASTGKASTPTPLGEFHIWSKLAKRTMRGPGYVQPNVPYVSYFDHSGDAVHGVYWRPASVFGHINTSHGCVGLQTDQAKWVYDWAPIGTTIINHV